MHKMAFLLALLCSSAAAWAQSPKDVGADTCRTRVPKQLPLKDPDSAKVGEVSGGQMETMEFHGTPIAVRKYLVPVNAKNSYGAYAGEKTYLCFTSEDGQRVLKVE